MGSIEKTYLKLTSLGNGRDCTAVAPAVLIVTVLYLIAVLSVPLQEPQKLIWLAAYPIVASEITGVGYGHVFTRSLLIIPFVGLIGMFNPIYDTKEAFSIGNMPVSCGWVSFTSIILRGVLSLQALILLVKTTGFLDIFNSLRKLGLPSVLTSQLLLTYRYLTVIMNEAIIMKRVREARGYGRKSYPLKMWGQFIGQLLLNSMDRATSIHRAMLARGFDGTLPTGNSLTWNVHSWLWLVIWTGVIACLRFIDFSHIIKTFLVH